LSSRRTAAAWLFGAAVVFLAASHAVLRAHAALAERLPRALEGVDLVVTGVIDEMPTPAQYGWRTRLRIESCEPGTQACPGPILIRLNWPAGPRAASRGAPDRPANRDGAAPFRAGERWRLTVRLRRPLAPQSPACSMANCAPGRQHRRAACATASTPLCGRRASMRSAGGVQCPRRAAHRPRRYDGAGSRPMRSTGARGAGALVVGDQSAIPGASWAQFNGPASGT
jgi:competence protein ComEC